MAVGVFLHGTTSESRQLSGGRSTATVGQRDGQQGAEVDATAECGPVDLR